MVGKTVSRAAYGISIAAIGIFIALTSMMLSNVEASIDLIWLNVAGSLGMGIYFGIASFIFENEHWSPLKQTVIHYILSYVVWFIVALSVGWISWNVRVLLITAVMFLIIYVLTWFGIWLYFRREAGSLNERI